MSSKPQPVRLALVNSESDDQKRFSGRSLAKSLGALFAVGGALVLGSASNANTLPPKDGVKELEIRVEKIQKKSRPILYVCVSTVNKNLLIFLSIILNALCILQV